MQKVSSWGQCTMEGRRALGDLWGWPWALEARRGQNKGSLFKKAPQICASSIKCLISVVLLTGQFLREVAVWDMAGGGGGVLAWTKAWHWGCCSSTGVCVYVCCFRRFNVGPIPTLRHLQVTVQQREGRVD